MNIKTKNFLGWLVLMLALVGAAWASYDAASRIKKLHNLDQEFNFGGSSIDGKRNKEMSLDVVIRQHLFGVVPVKIEKKKKAVALPRVVDVPRTKLNLMLTGIFSGSGPGDGLAMIEMSRGETSLVAVGQEIGKTGAKLYSVEKGYVLIDHEGELEKLSLERNNMGFANYASAEAVTIKEVELSQSELDVLSEVGQISEESINNPLIYEEDGEEFSDESYLQAELTGQTPFDDDEEFEEEEDAQ